MKLGKRQAARREKEEESVRATCILIFIKAVSEIRMFSDYH